MNIDTMFADMASAPLNSKGNYMDAGVYVVESKVIKVKDGFKGKSFIFEFKILKSNNKAHEVGSTGSQVVKLDKPQAWGDIKSLMFALALGIDPKTVRDPKQDKELHEEATNIAKAALDPDHAKDLGEEPNFLIGVPVRLECIKVKTQKGTDFTVHNYSPYVEDEAETKAAA